MFLGVIFSVFSGCSPDKTGDTTKDSAIVDDTDADDSGSDTGEQTPPTALSLQTEFGSEDTLLVEVDDIFAIWWDPAFDHSQDLEVMFGWLKEIRQDCLNNLGMLDFWRC